MRQRKRCESVQKFSLSSKNTFYNYISNCMPVRARSPSLLFSNIFACVAYVEMKFSKTDLRSNAGCFADGKHSVAVHGIWFNRIITILVDTWRNSTLPLPFLSSKLHYSTSTATIAWDLFVTQGNTIHIFAFGTHDANREAIEFALWGYDCGARVNIHSSLKLDRTYVTSNEIRSDCRRVFSTILSSQWGTLVSRD